MFYIYSIKNLETGKVYIGSRTRKVMLNRKPRQKFKYQMPSGEIEIMAKSHATRYHKDWILIGPVE